jgi:hypothetical protein
MEEVTVDKNLLFLELSWWWKHNYKEGDSRLPGATDEVLSLVVPPVYTADFIKQVPNFAEIAVQTALDGEFRDVYSVFVHTWYTEEVGSKLQQELIRLTGQADEFMDAVREAASGEAAEEEIVEHFFLVVAESLEKGKMPELPSDDEIVKCLEEKK